MGTAAKVLVAIVGLLLAVLGVRWMFAPAALAAEFAISLGSVEALNVARGDLGGMFLAGAALCGLGIASGDGRWLQALALVIGAIAVGRLVGVAIDGYAASSLQAVAVEAVMVGVLLWAASQTRATGAPAGR